MNYKQNCIKRCALFAKQDRNDYASLFFLRLVFVCHNQGNINMIKYTNCYSGAKTRHLYCSMENLHL